MIRPMTALWIDAISRVSPDMLCPVKKLTSPQRMGAPPSSNIIIPRVAPAALPARRLIDDMKMPAAKESSSVLKRTRTTRQNSSTATLPRRSGMPSTGKIAISPANALSEVAANLPRTMSKLLRSVRKRSPRVPSRFSSLIQSDVIQMPAVAA